MKDWSPVAVIIMWLSIVVGLILLAGAIAPMVYKAPMTGEKAKMLEDLVKSVITIISVFVGAKMQQQKDDKK